MTWADDFVAELLTTTSLQPEAVLSVVEPFDASFAHVVAQRERAAAQEKGRQLLLVNLDDEQRRTFEEGEWFIVTGSEGGRYCLHLGMAGNIFRAIDPPAPHRQEAHRGGGYCVHVRDAHLIPDTDNTLAQALLIKHDEPEFRRLARIQ